MTNTTVKEVTNAVVGQDADHFGGTDYNQLVQVAKGSHASERIQSSSIQATTWVTKSAASQTLGATEEYVLADATSNVVAITLPTAVGHLGGHYCIKKIDTSLSNLVTINTTSSQTIDGKTTYTLSQPGETVDLVSDGSNWRIVAALREPAFQNFRAKGATLGRWYTSELTAPTAAITNSPVAANMYAFPLIVTKQITIDSVAIQVVATGASSNGYAAIYADNGNLYPGVLIQDFGSVDTHTSTGVKTFSTGLPLTLAPGLYWLVFNCTATAPTVSGFAPAQMYPILGTTSALTAALGIGWTVGQAGGAFPNPFTAAETVVTAAPCPAVFFRTSG